MLKYNFLVKKAKGPASVRNIVNLQYKIELMRATTSALQKITVYQTDKKQDPLAMPQA